MVVTGVHRVLQFTQSPWLKPYIDFNTKQRALATSKFEKDFFKLMNDVDESSSTSFKRIEKMEDRKTAKGVKRTVKNQHLKRSHYKDTLMSLGEYIVFQNLMRSQDHVVTNRSVKKVVLTDMIQRGCYWMMESVHVLMDTI